MMVPSECPAFRDGCCALGQYSNCIEDIGFLGKHRPCCGNCSKLDECESGTCAAYKYARDRGWTVSVINFVHEKLRYGGRA